MGQGINDPSVLSVGIADPAADPNYISPPGGLPFFVGQVVDPTKSSVGDGTTRPFILGRGGDLITSQVHGRNFSMSRNGHSFVGHARGVGNLISATAINFALLNPPGSGVNFELKKFQYELLASVSVHNYGPFFFFTAQGTLLAHILKNNNPTLLSPGPKCLSTGAGTQSKAAMYTSTGNWPVNTNLYLCTFGGYPYTAGVAAAPNIVFNIDGMIVMPPGTLLGVVNVSGDSADAQIISMWWDEIVP